ATLVTAGLAGSYFIYEMSNRDKPKDLLPMVYGVVSATLILVSIVWSFSIIGSPKDQRNLRLDERRIQDLQTIQWQIISYYQQKEKLPTTLADLSDPISNFQSPMEPEFERGLKYEYVNKGGLTFE